MANGTPLEDFYSNLIATGKVSANEIGSYDVFIKNIQDATRLDDFYNGLINKAGFTAEEIGSPDIFKSNIRKYYYGREPQGNNEPPLNGSDKKTEQGEPQGVKSNKESAWGFLGAAAQKGASELNAMLYRSPELLIRAYNIIPNTIADITGIESFRAPSVEQYGLGEKNKLAKSWEDNADYWEQKANEKNAGYKKGVIGAISGDNPDWGAAGLNLLGGIIESSPSSIAMMLTAPMGTPAMITSGAAIFGAGKLQELDKIMPDMPEGKKIAIALSNGALEGIFESYLGSGAVGKAFANIIKNSGETEGKKIIKGSISDMFAKMIEKTPALAPVGEGLEEVGTQIAQNAVDKYSGYRPDIKLTDGAADAFLIGIGMGAGMGGGLYLTKKVVDGKEKTVIEKKEPELVSAIQQRHDAAKAKQQADEMIQAQVSALTNDDGNIYDAITPDNEIVFVLSGDPYNPTKERPLIVARIIDGKIQKGYVKEPLKDVSQLTPEELTVIFQTEEYNRLNIASEQRKANDAVAIEALKGIDVLEQAQKDQSPVEINGRRGVITDASNPGKNITILLTDDKTAGETPIIITPERYGDIKFPQPEQINPLVPEQEQPVQQLTVNVGKNEVNLDYGEQDGRIVLSQSYKSESEANKILKALSEQISEPVFEVVNKPVTSGRIKVNNFIIQEVQPVAETSEVVGIPGEATTPLPEQPIGNTEQLSAKQPIQAEQQQTPAEEVSTPTKAIPQQENILPEETTVQPIQAKGKEYVFTGEIRQKNGDYLFKSDDGDELWVAKNVVKFNEELPKEIVDELKKVNTNPTEDQKKAGNYQKAHITVQGMDISIENPVGSVRSGKDEDGKVWSHEMKSNYGYFLKTEGKDGDHIDTFVGNNIESPKVFVIDQNNPKTGEFDESKVMLGFDNAERAKEAYLENYDKDWKGFGSITEVSTDEFKKWLYDGSRQRKPFSEYSQINKGGQNALQIIKARTLGAQHRGDKSPGGQKEGQGVGRGEQGKEVAGKGKEEEIKPKTITEFLDQPKRVKELKPRKKAELSAIRKEAIRMDSDELSKYSAHGSALMYFIEGGKINHEALKSLFGIKGTTQDAIDRSKRKVETERRKRISYFSLNGSSIDQIAHQLWEERPEMSPLETSDYRDAIENVILSFNSPNQMANEFIRIYKEQANQGYTDEEISELEKIKSEMEQKERESYDEHINNLLQSDQDFSIFDGEDWVNLFELNEKEFYTYFDEKYTDKDKKTEDRDKPATGEQEVEKTPVRSSESLQRESEKTKPKQAELTPAIKIQQRIVNDLKRQYSEAEKRFNRLKSKLETSPEYGGKGQSDIFGNIAGSDVIDFRLKDAVNAANKKATQLRQQLSEETIKLNELLKTSTKDVDLLPEQQPPSEKFAGSLLGGRQDFTIEKKLTERLVGLDERELDSYLAMNLSGDGNKKRRQALMNYLAGEKVPVAKSGITAIKNEIIKIKSKGDVQFMASKENTIIVDGIKRPTINSNGQPIYPTEKGIINFWKWFGNSAVVDERGRPIKIYSGHSNVELYGDKYDPKKGTAGGFYGSENPKVASGYAENKWGIREWYENGNQYRIKGKNGKYNKKLWQIKLTDEQKTKLDNLAKEVDKNGEHIYWGLSDIRRWAEENYNYDPIARRLTYQPYNLANIWAYNENMGYNIAYLKQKDEASPTPDWMRQQKNETEEILDALGIEWSSYDWMQPGVMPVYLSIRNPLDADKPFPKELLNALKEKAKGTRKDKGSDEHWTKNYSLRQLIDDIESGSEGWTTQVPTKAFEVFRSFGYDGIKERGEKGVVGEKPREERSINWIALYPNQIKSAIGNRGSFSSERDEIQFMSQSLYSPAERALFPKPERATPPQSVINKVFENAKNREDLGVTDDFDTAGYLLPDGEMIDIRSQGNDHRIISAAYYYPTEDDPYDYGEQIFNVGDYYKDPKWIGSGTPSMLAFMDMGAIRLMPESNGIDIRVMPTSEQMSVIKRLVRIKDGYVILDMENEDGERGYAEYPKGTPAERVVTDIRNFFKSGMIPVVDDVMFMSQSLYSPTERALSNIKQDKATPEQWKAVLLKSGAKETEMEWMGWDEFAKERKSITKQEIQDWIEQNKVRLEEVMKEKEKMLKSDVDRVEGLEKLRRKQGRFTPEQAKEYNNLQAKLQTGAVDNTKFSQYTTPGGTNYKEWLLTMPIQKSYSDLELKRFAESAGYDPNNIDQLDDARRVLNKRKGEPYIKSFKSPHFNEPNIVVHVRTNERTDVDNARVLMIEEIQSDIAEEIRNLQKKIIKGKTTEQDKQRLDQLLKITPFANTQQWVGLALKRMVQYAAENGFDKIAWTTGEQQIGRYDLSKQVDGIEITPADIDTYPSDYKSSDGKYYQVLGIKGGKTLIEEVVPKLKVSELVGKEISEKAFSGQTKFTGDDLRIGGQGMKSFYDQIIPNTANKLFGKYGVKVGTGMIYTGETGNSEYKKYRVISVSEEENETKPFLLQGYDGLYWRGINYYGTEKEADDKLKSIEAGNKNIGDNIHEISITPQLADVASGGFPMFQIVREEGAARLNNARTMLDNLNSMSQVGKPAIFVNSKREAVDLYKSLGGKSESIINRMRVVDWGAVFLTDVETIMISTKHNNADNLVVATFLHEKMHNTTKALGYQEEFELKTAVFNSIPNKEMKRLVTSPVYWASWASDQVRADEYIAYRAIELMKDGKLNLSDTYSDDQLLEKIQKEALTSAEIDKIINTLAAKIFVYGQQGNLGRIPGRDADAVLPVTRTNEGSDQVNERGKTDVGGVRYSNGQKLEAAQKLIDSFSVKASKNLTKRDYNVAQIDQGVSESATPVEYNRRRARSGVQEMQTWGEYERSLLPEYAQKIKQLNKRRYVDKEYLSGEDVGNLGTQFFTVNKYGSPGLSLTDIQLAYNTLVNRGLIIPHPYRDNHIIEAAKETADSVLSGETKYEVGEPIRDYAKSQPQFAGQILSQPKTPQTETEAFKKWFSGSVVTVDGEPGSKPLVVYHGSPVGDIKEFESETGAVWFTEAKWEAENWSNGGMVYPVFLSIKNPYIIKETTTDDIESDPYDPEWVKEKKGQGYDGVVAQYLEGNDLSNKVWVVFSPTQIKSATGNRGTFDPNNPDINFMKPIGGNSGYIGYSMSRRAFEAHEEGKLTYSKLPGWAKRLVDAGLVTTDEWHHTSSYGNKTPFYNIGQFNILSTDELSEIGIKDWDEITGFNSVPKKAQKIFDSKSKIKIKEKNDAKTVRQNFISEAKKELKDFNSKFDHFTRVPTAPKYGHITNREMNGKYGWFNSEGKYYSLPEYFSGIDYKTEVNYNKFNELQRNLYAAENRPIPELKLNKLGFTTEEIYSLYKIGAIPNELMPDVFYEIAEKNKDVIKSQVDILKNLPGAKDEFNPTFPKPIDDFLTEDEKAARQQRHSFISDQGDNFGTGYERKMAHEENDLNYMNKALPRYEEAKKEYLNSDKIKKDEQQFNEAKNKAIGIIGNILSLFDENAATIDEQVQFMMPSDNKNELRKKFINKLMDQGGEIPPPIEPTVGRSQGEGTDLLSIPPKKYDFDIGVISTLAPYSKGRGGKRATLVMREHLGNMTRSFDLAEKSLRRAKEMFDKSSNQNNLDFIDILERGFVNPDPELQKIADTIRNLLDTKRDQIRALGTGKLENFIENYFPHIWNDPKRARSVFTRMFARRPFQGSKSFLKQRSIEYTIDGINAGLEPVSWNPVDLALLKIREMDKYLMAHKVMQELKTDGLVKFARTFKDAPDDFVKINDSISTVYSVNDKKELVIRGNYYAQRDAARIINNYLSPGLHGMPLYDIYRSAGNALNQFQLGLSAFHLGFTSMDATVSKFALGINKIFYGDAMGLLDMIKAPSAPVTNIILGNKIWKAWYGDKSNPQAAIIADVMAMGGGKAAMDKFYEIGAISSLKRAIKDGSYIRGIFTLPFAVVDKLSEPIMKYLVPRQKLGVFADIIKMEMERNPNMTHDELREIAQRAWDSVDNRMGQLVYDNLFWNKVVKDMGMASVRSLGWNLGTIREVGGGAYDSLKAIKDLSSGKKTDFTYRMAYLLALPIMAGIYGAIYQFLRTGEPPEELKDYYFPKTGGFDQNGDPARVSLPTYMKDIYHYYRSPGKTITNKLNPVNNAVLQMLTNKDYYGTEIRHPDDPLVKQGLDELKFIGNQFVPFGIRNVARDTRPGVAAKIEPFIGITPAPYDVNMTRAEEIAREYMLEKLPVGSRTQEKAERSKLKSKITNEIKMLKNNPESERVYNTLWEAVSRGELSPGDAQTVLENVNKTPLERMTRGLTVNEVAKLIEVAEEDELPLLIGIFQKKFDNKLSDKELTQENKEDLVKLYQSVIEKYNNK